jgi:putative hemolysin
MMGPAAAAFVILLVLSALLTAAHEAAFQLGPSRLRTLEEEGFRGAAALAEVRGNEAGVRWSVRLITQAANLSALAIATLSSVWTWGETGPVPSAIVSVVVIVVVGEIIPRAVAARHPVRLALWSAPVLLRAARWARTLTGPIARLEGNHEGLTNEHRELREIQEIGEEEGVLEESENLLVERAFRLDELTAWDVMIPRVDIFAWNEERRLADVVADLSTVPYSRVPVYRGSVDDITGIVYIREVYERFASGERDLRLRELARPPFFVPGSLSLAQLLQDFQASRVHMGIVADEFGGTDGLVTLEDVLEELVGEIRDETDVEEEEIVRISGASLECSAGVDVRDLEEALAVSLPKAEHRSLNGFILEELGHVPPEGETFERAGVRIDILEATDTQVVRARLTRVAAGGGGVG